MKPFTAIDFQLAKTRHLQFKSRLRAILYDELPENEATVLSQYACSVGQWLYSHALIVYEDIPEIHELERVHASIHVVARDLVQRYKAGEVNEARRGLAEMEQVADRLVELLQLIEGKVSASEQMAIDANDVSLAEPTSLLMTLLTQNEQLDARIKQQIETGTTSSVSLASERQVLHDFFMQAPAAHCVLRGPDHIFELTNPAYQDLIGDRAVLGQTVREALPDLEGQGFFELLDTVFTAGEPFVGQEMPVQLDYGQRSIATIYVNFVYQPIKNKLGQAEGILVFAYDVTEQVLARYKIQETEEALRGAVELADLGTWELDVPTGLITYSDRIRRWCECRDNTIGVAVVYNPIHERDRPRIAQAMAEAARPGSGGLLDEEYRIVTRQTGRHLAVHTQAKMYFDAQGQPQKMIGNMRDVTEQRQLQLTLEHQVQERTRELQESVHDLKRSNANLQQFAYIASHDLQEPLRKIQSFGDLLLTRYALELGEGADYLARMQSAAHRMSALIRDLLTFSRIETRQGDIALVSLNEVVNVVLNDLSLVIQETGAQVDVALLPVVSGDQSQLEQLFQNLLSNALKFRRADTIPRIQLDARIVAVSELPASVMPTRRTSAYHRLNVTDNGIGFDEKYVDRIFQVFQRLHSKTEFTGTGVGLAICEKVVANHGGAITASSQPNQGTTFHVYLPLYQAETVA